MQQTEVLSNNTPTDLSPSFQEWLSNEKSAARNRQAGIIKWTAFFVAVVSIFVLKDHVAMIQDFFNHTVIAQP